MNTITLSGWAQSPNIMEEVSQGTNHIAYGNLPDIESLFNELSSIDCDKIVGWSLGGQLAIRAVAAGVIKPEIVELYGAPYKFIANEKYPEAMPRELFDNFVRNFEENPKKTLKQFSLLTAKGDKDFKNITRRLQANISDAQNWLYWLKQLGAFSCDDIDFTNFPQTNIYHGHEDAVVFYQQTSIFESYIKNCKVNILEGCGHFPSTMQQT